MSRKSFWHFGREELSHKLITSISMGLVQSFILFAPRRIGKTEFLEYDLKPDLEAKNYQVIYFSFYSEADNLIERFMDTLKLHVQHSVFKKLKISEINLSWCRISLNQEDQEYTILELLSLLAIQTQKENKTQLVLLLDEVQELQNSDKGRKFIAGLRTALDLNKEGISVIFTGSSQDGLGKMFNERSAPFFHYGLNIKMELFGREFTDFLADRFYERVKVRLDKNKLFDIFIRLNYVTEYIRNIINKMVIEPKLSLEDAYKTYIDELFSFEKLEQLWANFSVIEKAVLLWLNKGYNTFYTKEFQEFASIYVSQLADTKDKIAKCSITQGKIQYTLEKLIKNQNIIYNSQKKYEVNNLFLKEWINNNIL